MGKTAFLFAGQGAQAPGMGKELFALGGDATAVFEMAEKGRGGTKADCFISSAGRLSQTEVTQPCVFTVDLAAACALAQAGVLPDGVAGFSLGEVAALAFAGAFAEDEESAYAPGKEDGFGKNGFPKAFALVCERGRVMAEAAKSAPGGMCAVLKLPDEKVEQVCAAFTEKTGRGFYPVNYNCPGQLVVALPKEDMPTFSAVVKEMGGLARELAVSGAFHSPYMDEAAAEFGACLQKAGMRMPALPVYANRTAAPYGAPAEPTLEKQMCSPVRFCETIERMGEDGFDTFVEVGPGKTLCGFVKRILPKATLANVQDKASLDACLASLGVNAK